MADKLNITTLEFEDIKQNLKDFLTTQSTFKDYNFEGSAMSILINLLAYNTYYNAYYLNMLANESFIDTAVVRNSLLSKAKELNYTPTSRRAPTAIINLTVTPPGGNTQGTLTLDRFTEFQAETIDGINYTFVAGDAHTSYKENGVFPFTDIELKAGTPQTVTFTYDPVNNPRSEFSLPNDDIDTSTLQVVVQESSINAVSMIYNKSEDITDSDATTAVYYLSTSVDNLYKLVFGDGQISRALSNGNIIVASYLTTDGDLANRANSFATGSIGGFSNVAVTPVSAAAGGSEREEAESIRFVAPLNYTAQGRCVTTKDYETLIRNRYPAINTITVWGGEENVPPVYGKVFISFAPKTNVIINDTEKQRIIDEIITPISMVTVTPVIVDPDYVYIKFATRVEVLTKLTTLTTEQISDVVKTAILNYTTQALNQFGSSYVSSKCGRAIDDSMPAIVGSSTEVRMAKRFTPSLNIAASYSVDFKTELHRSTFASALRSSSFMTNDAEGISRLAYLLEVPDSFTGLDSIDITNPGYGYTTAPTVTITGDGSGATAVATIVNGRLETVTLVNRGTGYSSALVFLSGGGGSLASASAVVSSKYGDIKLVYTSSTAELITIDPAIGTIDYVTGTIFINSLKITDPLTTDGLIEVSVEPFESIITTTLNQLLTVDQSQTDVITVDVHMR